MSAQQLGKKKKKVKERKRKRKKLDPNPALTVKKKYYENYYVCSVTQSNKTIITILNPQPSYWYLST